MARNGRRSIRGRVDGQPGIAPLTSCTGRSEWGPRSPGPHPSLHDLRYDAGTDGAVPFADRKARPLFQSDRLIELDRELGIVARHHHLDIVSELDGAGDVGGAEVELRTIIHEEGRVAPA